METAQPGGSRHEEPNEFGFAGDPTAPQPERPRRSTEEEEAEEVAVPADDFTEGLSESLDDDRLAEFERDQERGSGG